ncbi:MAG: hypothetical protein QM765_35110 [Myxococcales bacterium]
MSLCQPTARPTRDCSWSPLILAPKARTWTMRPARSFRATSSARPCAGNPSAWASASRPMENVQAESGEAAHSGAPRSSRSPTPSPCASSPKTSRALLVAPPQLEWNQTGSRLPPRRSTWPFVASTAAFARSSPPRTPAYTWQWARSQRSYPSARWRPREARAKVRDTTACASRAAGRSVALSEATTPRT